MKYAKLIENQLEFAPQNKGSIINYNTNVELMKADGYKLFVETERPVTNRMYHIGYNETSDKIQEVIVFNETQKEADERERQEEQTRIDSLTMTALDFIGVLEHFGLDYATQIKPFLESHQDLDKQLKYCQNVWCRVAKQVFAIPIEIGGITINSEMVEQAFKDKYDAETNNIQD